MHLPTPVKTLWILRVLCALCGSLFFSAHGQTPTIPPVGVRGYIYIEPFEIRKEFVLPLRHLTDTLELPAAGDLDAAARETLLEDLGKQLSGACPILADGAPLDFELDRIQFVVVDPRIGVSPDTRDSVPVSDATVAAVFVLARDAPPKRLEIRWDFFPDDRGEVPVALEVSSGTSMEFINHSLAFTPSTNIQSWDIPDIGPPPALLAVSSPPRNSRTLLYIAGVALLISSLAGFVAYKKYPSTLQKFSLWFRIAPLAFAVIVFYSLLPFGKNAPGSEEACTITDYLLQNIYHAFAYRDESRIFDTLSNSVSGDLLENLYLDIRTGLELENAGGPRVKIHRVVLGECEPEFISDPGFIGSSGFVVNAAWTASGNVSHWGHIHPRRNKYRGRLLIEAVDGTWKVTGVTILEEERQ